MLGAACLYRAGLHALARVIAGEVQLLDEEFPRFASGAERFVDAVMRLIGGSRGANLLFIRFDPGRETPSVDVPGGTELRTGQFGVNATLPYDREEQILRRAAVRSHTAEHHR